MTMHPDEIEVSVPTVEQLILDQFPEWTNETVEELHGAGTENTIFRIGATRAARFPRRASSAADVAEELEREALSISELAGLSPVPAPTPIAIGRPSRHYPFPWSVQSWLPGDVARSQMSADSCELAREIAELVHAFRSAPLKGRRFTGTGRGGTLSDSDTWMETCFFESANLLDVPRLRALWADFRTLPREQPDAMTHGDLIPANIVLRDNHLAGVLDTGNFSAADPSLDLIVAWHFFDVDARNVFREALSIDELEWQRGAAWAFQQAMGLVWYYESSNPTMAQLGRSTLTRICADAELSRALATA
ncbi:aminoglycoside phosphotransferase family protein [Nesterenkonia salmonea]|uniref:Aminoglycoside phosphotransferase family protein n=1 Tax=Nesterenkonia salmonea TaxID=1804987 RepID=A0A5R9B8B2_9MICC|nr:aminoglycoside phosphotransferase family protein [Nesterenkonia salmonea]TLP92361.1 aminoglycoside phosphotransferase family protein [Nesterenkonia salmonea]